MEESSVIQHFLQKGREQGLEEGEVRAKRQALLMLLQHRFGKIPEQITDSINTVEDPTDLDVLFEAVLDGRTLERIHALKLIKPPPPPVGEEPLQLLAEAAATTPDMPESAAYIADLFVVMGLKYEFEVIQKYISEEELLRSPLVQEARKKGVKEGKTRAKYLQVLAVLQKRFGKLPEHLPEQIKTIESRSDLERILEEAQVAETLEDIQTLEPLLSAPAPAPVSREPDPKARADYMAAMAILSGLRYDYETIQKHFKEEDLLACIDVQNALKNGRAEGIKAGESRGKRQGTLMLLQHRFETLPEHITETVNGIESQTELDALFDAALNAETLEDVPL